MYKHKHAFLSKINNYVVLDELHPEYEYYLQKWYAQMTFLTCTKELGFKIINAISCGKKVPYCILQCLMNKFPKYFP